jgi:Skp family chaperone for outer membrane proteins
MKTYLVLLFLALAVVFGSPNAMAQTLKVGTVDVKRVFESYDKAKAAEAKINETRDAAKKELEDRVAIYKKAVEEIKKLNEDFAAPAESDDARAEKQKTRDAKATELRSMEQEIRSFQAAREKQIEEQSLRVRSELEQEVSKVVADIAKAGHYNVVLNKSARTPSGIPIVLYSLDEYEFTDDVIKAINQAPENPSSNSPTATPVRTAK